MKVDIHPTYFPKALIGCACGATLTTGSTRENLEVEICSNCHPFYTGTEKLIDTAGRVERFRAKVAKAASAPKKKIAKAKVRKPK